MNNLSSYPAPPGLQPLTHLVKPEQIPKLVGLAEDKKPLYQQAVAKLWETIRSKPPDTAEYKAAYTKLHEVSESLKRTINQAARAAQSVSRPAAQNQVGQLNPRMPGQVQGSEQISPKIIEEVSKMVFSVPPEQAEQGPQHAQNWLREARNKYALHLHKYETAQVKLSELGQLQAKKENNSWNPQEAQKFNAYKAKYDQMSREAKEYLQKFKSQQEGLKRKAASATQGDVAREPHLSSSVTDRPQSILDPQNSQPNTVSDHQGQPHTVSSALDAARNHVTNVGRPSAVATNTMQPVSHSKNLPATTQNQESSVQSHNSQSQQNNNPNGGQSQQNNSPQVPNPQTSTSQVPHPLSQRAAINQAAQIAQSYPQPNYQNPTPQSTTHAHPNISNIGNRDPQNSNVKMPIPKELKIPHPQPVTMGPARPTLSGGPSNGAIGPMGQPAIQKYPGYVLEGEGERVLGRKKLEELVRQVTGGVDGEEGETLTAAAEETLLDVADDFIDQVTTAACKLAKLRSAPSLELRDIQLVLERNYNIRIPGYASDELRTVKKIQPTPSWTQKLAAVQAAKVTGGKADI
ncbi:MAG: hypothetical protein LQ342_002230 [Letrouitia transgressa]|nr:MAG: hypothetical protein LQ342_002230 [Letrouitia transgressa]